MLGYIEMEWDGISNSIDCFLNWNLLVLFSLMTLWLDEFGPLILVVDWASHTTNYPRHHIPQITQVIVV